MERKIPPSNFSKTRLCYAVVVRGDLDTIECLKNYIIGLDLVVVYQTLGGSSEKIWIQRGDGSQVPREGDEGTHP